MTARVLVVDDILANVKLLDAKLTAEYFDVCTAMSGEEALETAEREKPDIILLDVMMPGMDGFEVCRRLKEMPETRFTPVIMVTALDQPADRVRGLEAGADDFLTKPVEDIALFARVKSLVRLKMMTDELRMREATGVRVGAMSDPDAIDVGNDATGSILLVEDRENSSERLSETLIPVGHTVTVEGDASEALLLAGSKAFDLIVVSLSLRSFDGLRLCSQLRSLDQTRATPILVLVEEGDTPRLVRALDIGINDYLMRPVERNELIARVRTQMRRKLHQDCLRDRVNQSLQMAVTDELTGLYNRRYMADHLDTLVGQAADSGRPLSVLIVDIDHFKQVNDSHGHDVGDEVLREFGRRLVTNIRGRDMACRYGGEEFVVVMPDTDMDFANRVAERLRTEVADVAFNVGTENELDITISVGLAMSNGVDEDSAAILKRADQALYRAKSDGRNRVVAAAA